MARDTIVIVGAGIIGLDVALVLAQRGYGRYVTVVAEHHPGDTNAAYTSPWAGCNFSAISGTDANALRWDQLGYSHLTRLASEKSEESFVKRTESTELWDEDVPHDKIQAMSQYLEDFRILPGSELPEGVKFAVSFTTLTINAPEHIQYLYQRLQNEYSVRFVRQKLPNIRAAYTSRATEVVFNCVGNAARSLPGVADTKCYPTRGQVVLVRAPSVQKNIMRHGRDYETYVIPRPSSNGHVILGGFMQKGNGDKSTYRADTESILRRTTDLSAELAQQAPEVVAAFTGLRPSREGGARIEREDIAINDNKRILVHNYGAGGTGFQAGYGMATEAVDTIQDFLQSLKTSEIGTRSRL
ncbi:hypothetical protein PFICI_09756 [Pestalotiopsis fici W106-1]|uniref:FAD dependent oxidoreductase domain-containing protein n=1 Tax=Pestalotiopsis fici (strain W106-1 / CGMCC3.15140) TaxID=1229662 RepID=W3WV43_PESFW|nr:uncharacterized protein PFICI_09756 [Pestalotiopsis fici W106-1]ETS77694.1 hypothetical protein PFICI_09756 [Pestalotiopsis fici W106-1]